jgi:hypothetical protein
MCTNRSVKGRLAASSNPLLTSNVDTAEKLLGKKTGTANEQKSTSRNILYSAIVEWERVRSSPSSDSLTPHGVFLQPR